MDARSPFTDRLAIRAIVDGWIMWRDGGDWERLRAAWHPGGRMSSTRFDGAVEDFVEQTKRAHAAGARVRHTLNGFWCELNGDRAFSVAGMSILQRAKLHNVVVDVTCIGSFVDFFSYRNGRWALDRRQPAYDRDRIDPVIPGTDVTLDTAKLATFPEAYRHLAYLQDSLGLTINFRLPETRGASFAALMAEAHAWIHSASAPVDKRPSPPRRVVAAEDETGKSQVTADENITQSRSPTPGLETRLIWATDKTNDYRKKAEQIPQPKGIAPPSGGSRFSILDIAPGHRSESLHRTDTLDYVICLSGTVNMLLDSGAVTLGSGDVLIQCGTSHGWANDSNAPARIAVILLDGHPKRTGSISGSEMAP
jgi:quercetin dioxygenase-like cupin family protein